MSAKAGWYPDTTMTGTQRYWDGEEWTETFAPLEQGRGYSGVGLVAIIALGILAAIVVVLVVYWFMHATDGLECATENAERAADGRPTLICPE